MKIQCDIRLDLETGSYDVRFHNLSEPGAAMDYLRIRAVLKKVLEDFDAKQMKKR
jgi:hypothetical protein